jgi:lipoprotein-anchoring transpeptidase ErfK/SrfK
MGENDVMPRRQATGGAVIVLLLLLLAIPSGARADGTSSAATTDSAASATVRLLPGIRVGGVDVGGMTPEEAAAAVSSAATRILQRPIEVLAGDLWMSMVAQTLGARVDDRAALDQALAVRDSLTWSDRLFHRLTGRSVDRSFDLAVTYDNAVVRSFARSVADKVGSAPRDAILDWVDGALVKQQAKAGAELDLGPAINALRKAVRGGLTIANLPVRRIDPSVTGTDLGTTIIVRLSQNKLSLYDGVKLIKTYSVATAAPGYTTPLGHWSIVLKRMDPTWVNPAQDTWGADEPAVIPPGPGNPLGTRALNLDAPGIRIHGTYADSSIGTYASHGCIRMHIWDSEELFDLVEVGTPVIIVD